MANAWIVPPLPFTVTSPHTGFGDPAYLGNDYAGVVWRSYASTGPYLLIDLGRDMPVDTVMLFGIRNAPAASAWQVWGSTEAEGTTGGPAQGYARADGGSTFLAGTQMLASGAGVAMTALPATWPAALRYLRIEMAPGVASTIQLARLVIGKRIQLARNFSFGASFGVRDLGNLDFSRRGVLLRARGAKLRTASLTFSNVRKEEVEATTKPLLERIGNTEMVALVTDPALDAQRINRCYFGPLVGDLGHTWRNAAAWEAKTNLVSIF